MHGHSIQAICAKSIKMSAHIHIFGRPKPIPHTKTSLTTIFKAEMTIEEDELQHHPSAYTAVHFQRFTRRKID